MNAPSQSSEELATKLALLEDWTKKSIDYVNGARKKNRGKATGIKVAVLALSGLATILLGLNIATSLDAYFKNIAFALTSIVTVLNALEPFFNYRALWVEHERAKARFSRLYDQIRFYKSGKENSEVNKNDVNEFFSEYDRIWSTLNDAWSRERRQLEEATAAAAARKAK